MHFIFKNVTQRYKIHRHLVLVFIFAILYWISNKIEMYFDMNITNERGIVTDKKVGPLSLFRCFYFSLITQTTVGYGHHDIPTLVSETCNIFQLLSIFGIYLF